MPADVSRSNMPNSRSRKRSSIKSLTDPPAGRLRLPMAEFRQRDVHVPNVDVDLVMPGFVRQVSSDIALTLSVPDQPQLRRPVLPNHTQSPSASLSVETACGSCAHIATRPRF